MSVTNGEAGMRNITDNPAYERLEKDVTAVKNDIAALAGQMTVAINSFAGTAKKQAKHGYKQARAQVESTVDDVTERGGAVMDAAQDAAYSIDATVAEDSAERPLASGGVALGLGAVIGVT